MKAFSTKEPASRAAPGALPEFCVRQFCILSALSPVFPALLLLTTILWCCKAKQYNAIVHLDAQEILLHPPIIPWHYSNSRWPVALCVCSPADGGQNLTGKVRRECHLNALDRPRISPRLGWMAGSCPFGRSSQRRLTYTA